MFATSSIFTPRLLVFRCAFGLVWLKNSATCQHGSMAKNATSWIYHILSQSRMKRILALNALKYCVINTSHCKPFLLLRHPLAQDLLCLVWVGPKPIVQQQHSFANLTAAMVLTVVTVAAAGAESSAASGAEGSAVHGSFSVGSSGGFPSLAKLALVGGTKRGNSPGKMVTLGNSKSSTTTCELHVNHILSNLFKSHFVQFLHSASFCHFNLAFKQPWLP